MAIINTGIRIEYKDLGYENIKRLLLEKENAVYVGLFATDKNPDLVKIGAVNEFGAIIQHPGGTPYGYRSKRARLLGKLRFIKKDGKGIILGITGPHSIVIPPRSFIRSVFWSRESEIKEYAQYLIKQIIEGMSKSQALTLMGIKLQIFIKEKIGSNIPPPNAYSTVFKKKSSKTLIDTGHMQQSVTWEIRDV